ncbi:LysR family transcriptional regulator [Kiloniella antarctica]
MTIKPPHPKGPPLNSLRAFEAAARHSSFSLAAEELSVTPGAIAQHIKALESWTNADLFERQSQGVKLTPLGLSIRVDFTTAFDQLGGAVQKLRSQAAPKDIRIAALPSIAQLWVSPRLPAIRRETPEVSISLTAMEKSPNLKRASFDLSIFFEKSGKVSTPEQKIISICEDFIFPVCAPSVAKNLSTLADLANETLLHDTTWSDDWVKWLSYARLKLEPVLNIDEGVAKIETSGPVFSLYSLALEEVKNGAGVLIGHEPLVRDALKRGELVQPFKLKLKTNQTLSISMASSTKTKNIIPDMIKILTI